MERNSTKKVTKIVDDTGDESRATQKSADEESKTPRAGDESKSPKSSASRTGGSFSNPMGIKDQAVGLKSRKLREG